MELWRIKRGGRAKTASGTGRCVTGSGQSRTIGLRRAGTDMPSAVDDRELVRRAAARDVSAFLALQRRYGAFIRRTARAAGMGDLAEDVEQEVWLRLLEGRWRLAPHLGGTLYRFSPAWCSWWSGGCARPGRRWPGPTRTTSRRWPAPSACARTESRPSPTADSGRVCAAALAGLSPRDRAWIVLRYVQGLTVCQLAARAGRPPSTVGLHLRRIHRRLAQACGVEDYHGPGRGRAVRETISTSLRVLNSNRKRRRARARARRAAGKGPQHHGHRSAAEAGPPSARTPAANAPT